MINQLIDWAMGWSNFIIELMNYFSLRMFEFN